MRTWTMAKIMFGLGIATTAVLIFVNAEQPADALNPFPWGAGVLLSAIFGVYGSLLLSGGSGGEYSGGGRRGGGWDEVNPASGLPMVDRSGIDVGGNTYGTNRHG